MIDSFLAKLHKILQNLCLMFSSYKSRGTPQRYTIQENVYNGYFYIFILTHKFTCEQGLRKLVPGVSLLAQVVKKTRSHQWIWLCSCTNTVCKPQMYWLQKQIFLTELKVRMMSVTWRWESSRKHAWSLLSFFVEIIIHVVHHAEIGGPHYYMGLFSKD